MARAGLLQGGSMNWGGMRVTIAQEVPSRTKEKFHGMAVTGHVDSLRPEEMMRHVQGTGLQGTAGHSQIWGWR